MSPEIDFVNLSNATHFHYPDPRYFYVNGEFYGQPDLLEKVSFSYSGAALWNSLQTDIRVYNITEQLRRLSLVDRCV